MHPTDLDHHLTSLASLGDPLRRTLYRYVTNHDHPVSRDDAATATGISRPLAAYHLDKLVHDGLLEARYQHRSPRRGPGAGRPAKHYVRAPTPIELSLPPRDYATLADLLADAIDADPTGTAQAALHRAAATLGTTLATQTTQATQATQATTHPGSDPDQTLAALHQTLTARGYEPDQDPDGTIRLRNCPFARTATHHRQLICGANQAILQALTDHLDHHPPIHALLDPQPGRCCITLTTNP